MIDFSIAPIPINDKTGKGRCVSDGRKLTAAHKKHILKIYRQQVVHVIT